MLERMNLSDLATAADENLGATWALLGGTMGARVAQVGPLTLVSTGIPIAFFNGGTSSPRRRAAAAGHCGDRLLRRASGAVVALGPREPVQRGPRRRAGLGSERRGGPPAMGLDPIPSSPPPPAGLTIHIATDLDTLAEHAAVLRDGFEMPPDIVDPVIRPAMLEAPNVAVMVGHAGGAPVSCSLLTVTGTTAGVYETWPRRLRSEAGATALP